MDLISALALVIVGLVLVIYFAEKLVKGAVGTSAGFGVSTFVISVIFIGFDPENLAVGTVGSVEGAPGIALGSIIGAAMVAIALAFGVTAIIVPMEFRSTPRLILIIPISSVSLFAALAWDGLLSRIDGAILLAAFGTALIAIVWMSRRGIDIEPKGEVAETLHEAGQLNKWKAAGLMLLSLAAIIGGSEMLVSGSRGIVDSLGLSETFFGMTVLAFLVSVEELARELPAALKGRPEITYGNVVGSVLAFFCFNAGIIALAHPVVVGRDVLMFYLPLCGVVVVAITAVMWTRTVPRWAGAILVALYVLFIAGGYFVGGGAI